MAKVKIVSDSTCDLPLEILSQLNIKIIPANIIFGDTIYSHYDLSSNEFYHMLRVGQMPTTGVPSPKKFQQAFDEALSESCDVIAFTASKKLSALYSTAKMVSDNLFEGKITVFDSESATIEMGLIVYLAAKKAHEGYTKQQILEFLNTIATPNSQLIGVVNTLKYLKKGGRIGTISWLMGSLLSIKPIIHIEDGILASPGKVRGKDQAIELLQNFAVKILDKRLSETIFVGHSHDVSSANDIAEFIQRQPNAPKEVIVNEIGPVIGSHIGPGALGISWIGEYQSDWVKK